MSAWSQHFSGLWLEMITSLFWSCFLSSICWLQQLRSKLRPADDKSATAGRQAAAAETSIAGCRGGPAADSRSCAAVQFTFTTNILPAACHQCYVMSNSMIDPHMSHSSDWGHKLVAGNFNSYFPAHSSITSRIYFHLLNSYRSRTSLRHMRPWGRKQNSIWNIRKNNFLVAQQLYIWICYCFFLFVCESNKFWQD